ncbi:branched-chain amino acid aminotransferase [Tenacibaculum piscium]|uniref:Branched-chain-amino-acid aminotransferase n=1 Tax=Tenacibaculum piscium TaxID=1458515 RepID=A0A2H1YIQ0_9FLAO|nr:branched-chain amino acid aminotransferase [Tenacibaculum piscium]MBE7628589.1 branched-chain amino acid aminotransferase [Tenacibaculum piscium]MBE7669730.1 branched-chain amino acid aminotransferase [Tenacibaculum piscium]MBE7684682.1 branched-chain amino acid aminotransferase [Tenacibaculum piscium]MBE7689302.1 branched-chain amino acid aminotransferase [Tenacibaculum piscium]SOS75379.1 putative branched-chain-amino-acid aminotransferase [Tenacibaculum piscium]
MESNIRVKLIEKSKIDTVDFNNLTFGGIFSDHMFVCDYIDGEWKNASIEPYAPISLNPSAKIFHYGQSIFEGMKAYKDADNKTLLFRPLDNHKRLNKSAERLVIPQIPEDIFMDGLKKLLEIDNKWIPTNEGSSLYIRPFIFASGEGFHASPANAYKLIICTAPSGAYFSGDVKVLIEEKYARAANGGVGFAKAGGNYAAQFYPTKLATDKGYQQVIWTDDNTHQYIEEAGAMNIFIRINDTLITSPTSDRILDGITRKSILQIAEDKNIPVEVRKITVSEVVEAAENGSLKEMFGAGTAAVISPISGFGFDNKEYDLPKITDGYATNLKKYITDIQTNKSEDPYGWRVQL